MSAWPAREFKEIQRCIMHASISKQIRDNASYMMYGLATRWHLQRHFAFELATCHSVRMVPTVTHPAPDPSTPPMSELLRAAPLKNVCMSPWVARYYFKGLQKRDFKKYIKRTSTSRQIRAMCTIKELRAI